MLPDQIHHKRLFLRGRFCYVSGVEISHRLLKATLKQLKQQHM